MAAWETDLHSGFPSIDIRTNWKSGIDPRNALDACLQVVIPIFLNSRQVD
jgi:hypothetical protein